MDSCIVVTADMVGKRICFPMPPPQGASWEWVGIVVGVAAGISFAAYIIVHQVRRFWRKSPEPIQTWLKAEAKDEEK